MALFPSFVLSVLVEKRQKSMLILLQFLWNPGQIQSFSITFFCQQISPTWWPNNLLLFLISSDRKMAKLKWIVLHTARENFLIDAPESVVPASFNLFRNHNSELKLKMWILNSLRKPWKMKINTLTHNLFPLNYHNFAFATLPFLTNKHIWWRELNYIKAKTRRLLKDFLKSNSLKICCLIRNEEKASETLFRLNEHSWWSQKKCFDFRLIIFFSWFMHEIWSFGTFK